MNFSDLIGLDKELLLFFNHNNSLFLNGLVCTITAGWYWIPFYVALLYVIIKNNETMMQVMLALGGSLCCILLTAIVTELMVKPLVGRLRPLNDPSINYLLELVPGMTNKNFSFFSAHAANLCGLSVFWGLLIRSKRLAFFLTVWVLFSCYTRMYLGMHFPSDILVGLSFGACVGGLVYRGYSLIYQRLTPPNNYVSIQYTSSGYNLADVDLLISILSGLFVIAMLYSLFQLSYI